MNQEEVEQVLLEHADLIAQHNQAAAAVRAGLVELHDQLTVLKGLQAEIYNLEKPQAAAIVASLDNPMPHLASVHGNLRSLANQAGYKFPEWENEFIRGAKNGE